MFPISEELYTQHRLSPMSLAGEVHIITTAKISEVQIYFFKFITTLQGNKNKTTDVIKNLAGMWLLKIHPFITADLVKSTYMFSIVEGAARKTAKASRHCQGR